MRRLLILLLLCGPVWADDRLDVAVASSFLSAAQEIAQAFTAATGVSVRFSSGSTGKLYAQIVNGAPYDVFLAADTERPRRLQQQDLALPGTFTVYATGFLVLVSAKPEYANGDCTALLATAEFSRLAIANPETAPYGAAARTLLRGSGHWPALRSKLVFGDNVAQAFQFVATGNAAFGVVAASLAANDAVPLSCVVRLESGRNGDDGVEHGAVVLSRSKRAELARRFMAYLQTPDVKALLARRGYSIAPGGDSEP